MFVTKSTLVLVLFIVNEPLFLNFRYIKQENERMVYCRKHSPFGANMSLLCSLCPECFFASTTQTWFSKTSLCYSRFNKFYCFLTRALVYRDQYTSRLQKDNELINTLFIFQSTTLGQESGFLSFLIQDVYITRFTQPFQCHILYKL